VVPPKFGIEMPHFFQIRGREARYSSLLTGATVRTYLCSARKLRRELQSDLFKARSQSMARYPC